jgi:hypothetical protein
MPIRFSPYREGAAHSIEEHDVVLLRGTPAHDLQIGTIDVRICVRAIGSSDRAMWLRYPKHEKALGLHAEFHLWSHKLVDEEVSSIREHLAFVHRHFADFEPQFDANDVVDSLTFWAGKERFVASLLRPADARHRHSHDQIAAFMNACNLIHKLVPQPSGVLSV